MLQKRFCQLLNKFFQKSIKLGQTSQGSQNELEVSKKLNIRKNLPKIYKVKTKILGGIRCLIIMIIIKNTEN